MEMKKWMINGSLEIIYLEGYEPSPDFDREESYVLSMQVGV